MGEFVPLDAFVARRAPRVHAADAAPGAAASNEPRAERSDDDASRALVSELVFARLAALEAFERARDALLERLARDVLGRELALAPVRLAELARACLEAYAACEPVALVVAPGEAAGLSVGLPLREDAALAAGDLIVEVRDGEIDARFMVRVARALAG